MPRKVLSKSVPSSAVPANRQGPEILPRELLLPQRGLLPIMVSVKV